MSTWKQTGTGRWIVGTIHNSPELDDQTIIDLFNTDWQAAIGNPAVSVSHVDQFYTVNIDHDTWEIEAAVTLNRRYDSASMVVQGLDTP